MLGFLSVHAVRGGVVALQKRSESSAVFQVTE